MDVDREEGSDEQNVMLKPVLRYFADPMCSWCWGFSPVIEAVRERYKEVLDVGLVLGGLRPGTSEPLSQEQRQEILHHWQSVRQTTGQEIRFEGAMPEGFVYDTEPACRAVVAFSLLDPANVFGFFKSIQQAFYTAGQNVREAGVLAGLARNYAIDGEEFLQVFGREDTRKRTLSHFQLTHKFGVRGFPTLILQQDNHYHLLSNGYCPFDDLRIKLDSLIN